MDWTTLAIQLVQSKVGGALAICGALYVFIKIEIARFRRSQANEMQRRHERETAELSAKVKADLEKAQAAKERFENALHDSD